MTLTLKLKRFTASRQASAALMDEGADFVAGEGIDRALQASQCLPGEPCGRQSLRGRERRLLHIQGRHDL